MMIFWGLESILGGKYYQLNMTGCHRIDSTYIKETIFMNAIPTYDSLDFMVVFNCLLLSKLHC
jgi:hypothetical protein